ncbi:ABC transporter permease [Salisediminibacterium halotolerans]|uniref:ABC-2 type transport system permease protein n=1 Tax=Salisediminibacterium halotolerans TaxID=517425 RepID=A0A1H9THC4_9BACI|nr:ABC transporter permease [Salisediminibacterium haloalkalitolerans]SER96249.1 ABC-2 type transport system permease protein [Salisediminibacterium haloalkalitolerans]
MNDIVSLFDRRRSDFWQIAVRYLRLIGNSGFLFTIYLLFIFGSYYYGQFLQWLPETFPAVLFMTAVITWMMTRGRVRTFFQQADLIYLLPLESRLKPYFRKGIMYSWLMETFWTVFLFMLLTPFFFDRIAEGGAVWLGSVIALSLLKLWNLVCSFEEQRILDKWAYRKHQWMRLAVNLLIVYLLFSGQEWWIMLILGGALTVFYFTYYKKIEHVFTLKWERLVAIENATVMTFYRIANSFTDVPRLNNTVKRRRLIDPLFNFITYRQRNVYKYMFGRSFFRANDYFGIYLRLMLLGVIFIFGVDVSWGVWFVAGLFFYMTALQLETLARHYDTKQMPDLFPLSDEIKQQGLRYWLVLLLGVQAAVFSVMTLFTGELYDFASVLVICLTLMFYTVKVRPKKSRT